MGSFNSSDSPNGTIQIIFGPMFSGKTTELMRRVRRYNIAQKKCVVIKYRADTRYSVTKASTHDSVTCDAMPCSKLAEVAKAVENYDVIGIDEGQFFSDIYQYCEMWADEGRTVVVAALDGTFQRKPFGNILSLVPISEKITKLSAVCMICCERDAAFTFRMSTETEVEVIGGSDKYVAACRGCYNDQQTVELTNSSSVPQKRRVFAERSPAKSPNKN